VLSEGLSIRKAPDDLGMPYHTLHGWVRAVRRSRRKPVQKVQPRTKADAEARVRELEAEVRKLMLERDFLKEAAAASTGHRNSLVDDKRRRLEAERLPGPAVEPARDPVQVRLRVHRQVRPPREVLAQQEAGVLIRPALPRALRVAEVHLHVCRHREVLVRRHLEPAVPRERPAQLPRQRPHAPTSAGAPWSAASGG
jgi:transposase-like protein